MRNLIMDTTNLVEDGIMDDEDQPADLTATETAAPETMDFHIQMHGHTMNDFETMVIEVAAQKLINTIMTGDVKRQIQERATDLISKKIDDVLEPITVEFIDQPMLPKYFGAKNEVPMTIREYIGLCGRDFIHKKVNAQGEPAPGPYDRGEPRINRIVNDVLDRKFSKEIESSVGDIKTELKTKATEKLTSMIEEERKRLTDAIGYEITKRR